MKKNYQLRFSFNQRNMIQKQHHSAVHRACKDWSKTDSYNTNGLAMDYMGQYYIQPTLKPFGFSLDQARGPRGSLCN